MLAAITLYSDKVPILTVQKGCNKLCYAFRLRRGVTQIKTYVRFGGSQKCTRAYKGGGGGVKKVTILSVRTFWMTPQYIIEYD